MPDKKLRQCFTGDPALAGSSENKQQAPLLTPHSEVSSFLKMWVRVGVSPGVELEGELRWFVHPFVVLSVEGHMQYPALGSHTQYFCSRLFRNGSWLRFFFFVIVWSTICPNCTCTQLFLVPHNFFVSCSSRRGVSRCKLSSTGSQVPACLKQTGTGKNLVSPAGQRILLLKQGNFGTREWSEEGLRKINPSTAHGMDGVRKDKSHKE